jgi:hypothetical protein
MASPCFLVEWYRPALGAEALHETAAKLDESAVAMSEEGSPVQLLTILLVPPDEMVFALFAAPTADLVTQTCLRAGVPPERLTFAADLANPADA